jgi:hypothetical protein
MQRYVEKHEYNPDSDSNSDPDAHSDSESNSESNPVPINAARPDYVDAGKQPTVARATCDASSGRFERFSIDDFESDRGSECNVSY